MICWFMVWVFVFFRAFRFGYKKIRVMARVFCLIACWFNVGCRLFVYRVKKMRLVVVDR